MLQSLQSAVSAPFAAPSSQSAEPVDPRRGRAREDDPPRSRDAASLGDRVELSQEGLERVEAEEAEPIGVTGDAAPVEEDEDPTASDTTEEEEAEDAELSRAEQQEVRELKARDIEVRSHEQAHAAVGGGLAGSPRYEYARGDDGRQYAVGGEVSIQLKRGRNPEESLRNAEQARRAALAPAEPSAQDRSVAAAAQQMANEARSEIQAERSERRAAESGSADNEATSDGQRASSAYGEVTGSESQGEGAEPLSLLA